MTSQSRSRANGSHLRLAADLGVTVHRDWRCSMTHTSASSPRQGRCNAATASKAINCRRGEAGATNRSAVLFLPFQPSPSPRIRERKGAKTALLITDGFRDLVYEIGRINRPDAYNLFFSKHEPLAAALRFEVKEGYCPTARSQRRSTRGDRRILPHPGGVSGRAPPACSSTAMPGTITKRAPMHPGRNPPGCSCRPRMSSSEEYREFERLLDDGGLQRLCGPDRPPYNRRDRRSHSRRRAFHGFVFPGSCSPPRALRLGASQITCVRMLNPVPAAVVSVTQAVCHASASRTRSAFRHGRPTPRPGSFRRRSP